MQGLHLHCENLDGFDKGHLPTARPTRPTTKILIGPPPEAQACSSPAASVWPWPRPAKSYYRTYYRREGWWATTSKPFATDCCPPRHCPLSRSPVLPSSRPSPALLCATQLGQPLVARMVTEGMARDRLATSTPPTTPTCHFCKTV